MLGESWYMSGAFLLEDVARSVRCICVRRPAGRSRPGAGSGRSRRRPSPRSRRRRGRGRPAASRPDRRPRQARRTSAGPLARRRGRGPSSGRAAARYSSVVVDGEGVLELDVPDPVSVPPDEGDWVDAGRRSALRCRPRARRAQGRCGPAVGPERRRGAERRGSRRGAPCGRRAQRWRARPRSSRRRGGDGVVVQRVDVARAGRGPDHEHASLPARHSAAAYQAARSTIGVEVIRVQRRQRAGEVLHRPLLRVPGPAAHGSRSRTRRGTPGTRRQSRSWRRAAAGCPSGSHRPVPAVSSTPSKPAIEMVLSARSCCSRRTKSSNCGFHWLMA